MHDVSEGMRTPNRLQAGQCPVGKGGLNCASGSWMDRGYPTAESASGLYSCISSMVTSRDAGDETGAVDPSFSKSTIASRQQMPPASSPEIVRIIR